MQDKCVGSLGDCAKDNNGTVCSGHGVCCAAECQCDIEW